MSFVNKPLKANISVLNFAVLIKVNRAVVGLEIADLKEKEIWAPNLKFYSLT